MLFVFIYVSETQQQILKILCKLVFISLSVSPFLSVRLFFPFPNLNIAPEAGGLLFGRELKWPIWGLINVGSNKCRV